LKNIGHFGIGIPCDVLKLMSSSFEMILFGVYILVRRAVAGVVSKDELPILMKETIVSLKTIALYYLRPRQTQLETCFVLTFCTEHRLATFQGWNVSNLKQGMCQRCYRLIYMATICKQSKARKQTNLTNPNRANFTNATNSYL
jgi:hypothetical protein